MFDLENNIAAWKARFARQQTCSQDELDELESHLRDEIDALCGLGATASEAFAEAVSRMGSAEKVNSEFAKTRQLLPADKAVLFCSIVLTGIVSLGVAISVASIAAKGGSLNLAIHVATITLGYVGAYLVALTGIYSTFRRLASARNEFAWFEIYSLHCRRVAIAGLILLGSGIFTGGIWARHNLGSYWTWHPKEIGGLCMLLWYAITFWSLSLKPAHPKWLPVLSISGGIIGLLAWVGTSGMATAPFFIVGVAFHLVMLCIALRLFRRADRAESVA